jgi:hypothetical protein
MMFFRDELLGHFVQEKRSGICPDGAQEFSDRNPSVEVLTSARKLISSLYLRRK